MAARSRTDARRERDAQPPTRGAVLLTGASGQVGRVVGVRLERDGWRVRPFDLATGDDLRDADAVQAAARGCAAIVHAGAISHDSQGSAADIVATNLQGTWHVLVAAEQEGVERIVAFSSIQVFGCSEGEGVPDHLPIGDDHPLRAARPYGMSKRLGEDMCEAWTSRTSIPSVVLRPVTVVDDDHLRHLTPRTAEYGAFVHVDDVADAVVRALATPVQGHVRLILCGPGEFDSSAAARVLGWHATRRWPARQLVAQLKQRSWWQQKAKAGLPSTVKRRS